MRVAVLGGGTAGVMAATHISQQHSDIELFHVFDSSRPPIAVGEGTTPGFRSWLSNSVPHAIPLLSAECDATPKRGIQFENWGQDNRIYRHDFIPRDGEAVHISADLISAFLQQFVRADIIDRHVDALVPVEGGVRIAMDGRADLKVQLVIDARGFPAELTPHHERLTWIPTNAALVTKEARQRDMSHTRAVARPYGWIFVIPLAGSTSYGYVHSTEQTSREEVASDFSSFLDGEHVTACAKPRNIKFPNFVCRRPFEGNILKIGNAASFIEPLEATSIAVVKEQLYLLSSWLKMGALTRGRSGDRLRAEINRQMRDAVVELSLFVAWHYAMGSRFDTPFWRAAQRSFRHDLVNVASDELRSRFEDHLRHAWTIRVEQLRTVQTEEALNRLVPERSEFPKPLGGITPLGFAQIAHGILDPRRVTVTEHLASCYHYQD